MSQPILIDVHSDAVCPWCYVGKRRLEAALAARPDLAVEVRWKPFELNPDLPAGGADRASYMKAKFGEGPGLAAAHARLVDLGARAGIPFHFESIQRVPNTRAAHALVALAGDRADAVVEAIFAAYFERGEDIGALDVLMRIAEVAGLDPASIRPRVAAGEGFDAVVLEEDAGRRMGITGVPFFVFAGRWALSGAQEPAQFIAALDEVCATLARESAPDTPR
jgi:predicted DsbA family dithiol-disulfide isomerase